MLNNSFFRKLSVLFFGAVFFVSCDSDFNTIGTDIVGDDHFTVPDTTLAVNAFSQKTGAVQSNNLPINPLGVFDNGAFGKTKASFVTQVALKVENPVFHNVLPDSITSVVLNIPYYSTYLATDTDGSSTYKLDSLYGSTGNKIKLHIYENGYYLRDLDPTGDFQTGQKFYSDQTPAFNAAKGPLLNDGPVSQNEAFAFSPAELVTPAVDEDSDAVREAPGMRLNLNKQFFYNKLVAANDANLVNNDAFKNHFRGLYFQVEEGTGNAMAMMNFSQGTITVKYKDYNVVLVGGVETPGDYVEKTLVLGLTGNTVSLLEHIATPASQAYENLAGTENLYLKGGNGSVAFVDLFGGGNSAELEALRDKALANNWLINEANLIFYVDQPAMNNSAFKTADPNRVYLYDARNNMPLVDYYYDASTNSSKPKYGKTTYGGIVELSGASGDTDRKGVRYKLRITEHIKNVLFKDSTNVRLGLAVSESIGLVTNAYLKTASGQFSKLPVSSVLSPTGTVLFGSNAVDSDKRLKLEIYYTKPN